MLAGAFEGVTSPARQDSPLVGVDAVIRPGISVWPLRTDFEHGLVVLSGEVAVEGRPVRSDRFAYLGLGRSELVLDAVEPARVLLLGGVPFGQPILMWWNFVARSRARRSPARTSSGGREDGRFGEVHSALDRIPAPPPPWSR